MLNRVRTPGRPSQAGRRRAAAERGLAALTVVMGLFFVVALVAAYTNRSIVFEQRMSASSVRGERATAAAEAAVDWLLTMLNTGRIDTRCQPSTNAADSDFRSRYLILQNATGAYGVVGYGTAGLSFPGCKVNGTTLNCVCPVNGTGNVAIAEGSDNDAAFRVSFLLPGAVAGVTTTPPPGGIIAQVRGCANAGIGDLTCYGTAAEPTVDARTDVRSNLGLIRAVAAPPQATLTAGGSFDGSTVIVRGANRDNPTGLVLHTGGTATTGAGSTLLGPAGSTSTNTKLENDSVLAGMKAGNKFFDSLFGMPRGLFAELPGTVRIACNGTCTLADLAGRNWQTQFVNKVIYVDGDLNIDASAGAPPATVGSDASPVMLVVNGKLTISEAVQFVGLLYGESIEWSGNAATGSVRGALVAAGDISATAALTMTYDAAAMNLIRLSYGSFVRVPGGWNRGGL